MATTSGELLGGKFRPLGERIAFPFGTWWDAEDDQGARTLVLRLHAGVTDAAAKVKAAIDASHKVDSPHIVPWTAGGVDDKGAGWLAAPMFGPWSLTEHVSRGEGIKPAEAAPLMHQIARALSAAEAAGVPHQCLASEFIRLVPIPDAGNGIKVYGFGLSEALPAYKGVLRRQEFHLGVPDYMAPEVCDGKPPEGSSADIYAIGILMYEAVRGRPPFAPTFASASVSTTIKRHQFEKALPLHVRYANAPFIKSYETICFKALDKKANRRQLTLGEFEKELETLVAGEMRLPILSLEAIAAKSPTTVRRHRTQILPLVPTEEVSAQPAEEAAPVAAPEKVVHAEPAATAGDATQVGRPAMLVDDEEEAGPSVVVASSAEDEAEAEASEAAGAEEEAAAPVAAPASAPITGRKDTSTLVFGAVAQAPGAESPEEGEGDEEGAARAPAVVGGGVDAGDRGGKKSKKQTRKSKRPTTTVSAATTAAPLSDAGRSAATVTDKPAVVIAPTVDAGARVRRPMDKTVPASPAAFATMTEQRFEKKVEAQPAPEAAKPIAPVKSADAQDAWFDASPGDEGMPKKSKAWMFLLAAAVVVAVVVFLIAKGGGGTPAGATIAPPTNETHYGLEGGIERTPTTAPAADAGAADAGVADAGLAATDAGAADAGLAALDTQPAALDTQPAAPETQAAVVTEATAADTTVAQAEPAPAEDTTAPAKDTATSKDSSAATKEKDTSAAQADTTPPTKADTTVAQVDAGPTVSADAGSDSPEELFKKKAKDYIQKGIAAYQNGQYKLAAGWFKRALDADSGNALAARYLKEAEAKLAPP